MAAAARPYPADSGEPSTTDYALFVALALMLGASYPLTEVALRGFDPLTLVFIRLVIGAVFLLAWWLFVVRRRLRVRAVLPLLIAVGVLNTVGSFLLVTWGQEYVTASYTAILIAANPLFAAIGASVVLPDERLTRGRVVGIAVGFGGVVALFANDLGLGGETSGQNVAAGGTAILGGAAALAVVAIVVRSRLSGLTPHEVALPMVLTGVVSVGCVLAVLQVTGAVHLRAGDGASLRGPLLAAAILGLVNAGIGNIIYYSLIRSWGVARTALVGYVVPLIGVTLGVVLLHDHLAPNMVVGLVLISASLACLGPPREPEPGLT